MAEESGEDAGQITSDLRGGVNLADAFLLLKLEGAVQTETAAAVEAFDCQGCEEKEVTDLIDRRPLLEPVVVLRL